MTGDDEGSPGRANRVAGEVVSSRPSEARGRAVGRHAPSARSGRTRTGQVRIVINGREARLGIGGKIAVAAAGLAIMTLIVAVFVSALVVAAVVVPVLVLIGLVGGALGRHRRR